MGILADPIDSARDDSVLYAFLFVGVGVIVGLAMFFQILMLTVAGEHLTLRMRRMAFEAMLSQEIGWFDEPSNGTGALCARLSADAAAIQGVSTTSTRMFIPIRIRERRGGAIFGKVFVSGKNCLVNVLKLHSMSRKQVTKFAISLLFLKKERKLNCIREDAMSAHFFPGHALLCCRVS